MHFAFVVPLNKKYNELKALNDEKRNILIKTYDQLQMLIIDEVSLIGNRILTFIDHKLHDIKQAHNEFMGGLDVNMIGDFYKASLV
jgi:hypothetical protein